MKNREEKKLNTNYLDNNHLVLVGKVASEDLLYALFTANNASAISRPNGVFL